MAGPEIQGPRVTEHDVGRFEACSLCLQHVDTFVPVFVLGEPAYWCLPCFKDRLAFA